MIISVWRYSHLLLAISCFLLLILASISGIFLAFEPVIQKADGYKVDSFDTIKLAQVVPLLHHKFRNIQEVLVDDNEFVLVKYTNDEGGDKQVYVSPLTGKILGIPKPQLPFFRWMTNLHRSLFLHDTGRTLMGITALLLALVAVSGVFLVVQRQHGWRHFFDRAERTDAMAYYHLVFGRLSLFFILSIALTGTYLMLHRFMPPMTETVTSKINEETIREEPKLAVADFKLLQQTPLSSLKKLQYPFSDFPEDYYYLQLKDRELCLNQFTGEVLAELPYATGDRVAAWSLRLHTGRIGTVWALILAVASGYILFFIYSGFTITFKRMKGRSKNKFAPEDAEAVILVGSENGSTFRFADAVYGSLLKQGKKVYITDLDNYQLFPSVQHLVVMCSTYGQGDAPSNGKKFLARLRQYPQQQEVGCSVVGFGSRSYTHFCQFAYTVADSLEEQLWTKAVLPVFTVNDKSPQDVEKWLTAWTNNTAYKIEFPETLSKASVRGLKKLKVVARTAVNSERMFSVRLEAKGLKHVFSGDLLAVYPESDYRERLYSIGKIDKEIVLTVSLHAHGLGSNYLNTLQVGDRISVRILKNMHFRFPQDARQLIMVCNGTGIAPFLGMISENRKNIPVQLYCGFRTQAAFDPYRPFLDEQMAKGRLGNVRLALSHEAEQKYVSHHIIDDVDAVLDTLEQGGVLLICGSISMRDDVLLVLREAKGIHGAVFISMLLEQGKILCDCY